MGKHTIQELQQWQALPLDIKVLMTKDRIRQWVKEYGEDGVYVSFSGGKDSTVLLNLVREDFPNVPAVFVDVPTQYPELKEFAKTYDNLVILKPKLSFMEVCKKYGFPLISKEVSHIAYCAKKYAEKKGLNKEDPIPDDAPMRYRVLLGKLRHKEKGVLTDEYSKMWDKSRYSFMLDAPFYVDSACCNVMKKHPIQQYAKSTKRNPMIGTMATESKLRMQDWLHYGCNSFDRAEPISKPMSFWTEQDVLQYIKEHNIKICSVYGDIVEDWNATDDVDGQMTISDLQGWENAEEFDAKRPPLKTTGCDRTGCVLCGFGCHLEKPGEGRFERLKETHPGFYKLLDVVENNGVTYREAIEWINEHGGTNIRL